MRSSFSMDERDERAAQSTATVQWAQRFVMHPTQKSVMHKRCIILHRGRVNITSSAVAPSPGVWREFSGDDLGRVERAYPPSISRKKSGLQVFNPACHVVGVVNFPDENQAPNHVADAPGVLLAVGNPRVRGAGCVDREEVLDPE